ncbi:hypothetical protein T265_05173 [Opisthorchis viverrini]|uniref:Endonuclease/exonuclease/phosphatase domain-containing protein n=1 Tax=Opisthorchis viverrini TaxID=6198 RepID=A0A075AFL7_OPIVI|nr:hypothetical protein T265_05173 [Opisthorchis viverrini]KER27894.1 hypothetical protein T265_05173 [Opisthorchis viverrini]
MEVSTIDDPLLADIPDTVWLSACRANPPFILGRPPHSISSINRLSTLLFHTQALPHPNKLIVADLNLPEIAWSQQNSPLRLSPLLAQLNFEGWCQIARQPTRGAHTLDIALVRQRRGSLPAHLILLSPFRITLSSVLIVPTAMEMAASYTPELIWKSPPLTIHYWRTFQTLFGFLPVGLTHRSSSGVCRRPPHSISSINRLSTLLFHTQALPHPNKLIVADLNLPEIAWSQQNSPLRLSPLLAQLNFEGWCQIARQPTRGAHTLDIALVSGFLCPTAAVGPKFPDGDHCIVTCSWMSPLLSSTRTAVENVQCSFTKALFPVSSTVPYRLRCLSLGLDPSWLRRIRLDLGLLHRLIYWRAYLSDCGPELSSRTPYNIRNAGCLPSLSLCRTVFRQNLFLCLCSKLRNKLPSHIRTISSHYTCSEYLHSTPIAQKVVDDSFAPATCLFRWLFAVRLFEMTGLFYWSGFPLTG